MWRLLLGMVAMLEEAGRLCLTWMENSRAMMYPQPTTADVASATMMPQGAETSAFLVSSLMCPHASKPAVRQGTQLRRSTLACNPAGTCKAGTYLHVLSEVRDARGLACQCELGHQDAQQKQVPAAR